MTDDVRALFDEVVLGALATVNEDGTPWATPLHVFADDEAVYWFSGQEKQHSLNLERDPKGSVTVFSPDESDGLKGAFFNGTVEMLDRSKRSYARELVAKRMGDVPLTFESAAAYRLKIGELNRGKSSGKCWYFYS